MEGNRQDSREQGNDLIESSIERRAFSLLPRILFKKKDKKKEKKKTTTMMMIGMEEELTTFKREQKCRMRTSILLTSLYPIKVFLDKSLSISIYISTKGSAEMSARNCYWYIQYMCVEEYTGERASERSGKNSPHSKIRLLSDRCCYLSWKTFSWRGERENRPTSRSGSLRIF